MMVVPPHIQRAIPIRIMPTNTKGHVPADVPSSVLYSIRIAKHQARSPYGEPANYSATLRSMICSISLLESSITSATSSGIIGRNAGTFIREMKTSPWLS